MLELVLLGQPAISVSGEAVAMPTRKAMALIAYLAIEGPAPRARLADGLWPSIEPEKARGNLRRELNRLRHTPLGDEIVSEGTGISLSEPFSCDVREFSKKSEAQDFSGALELYRGPLLDGLELYDADGFDDWLARRRTALSERQRAMLALAAKSREQNGDLRGALLCFLDLIRLDATQESFHREAMRLHYLVGEREAALERFAELKRVLRRELALEPLPETIELYRSIRAAKYVAGADASEKKSCSLALPLVGRVEERKLLEASQSACVVILADPGVGKTRLAEEVARSRPGHLILRASEASSSTPLYPFATALRAAANDREMQQRISLEKPVWRREAARLVPEIDPEAPIDSLRQEARSRFLEGLARTLCAAVGNNGMLVLDDLQWFDAASVELSLHLLRRAAALNVRVIATARPVELRSSAASSLLEVLDKEAIGETLRLQPLGPDDVLALVRASAQSGGAVSFAQRLHELTGGNPLFVLETLKTLSTSGELSRADDGPHSLPVPSGVRDAVIAQVERLGPKVRRFLDASSLAGTSFSLDDLAGATGLGVFDAVDALESAIDAGLVVRDGDGIRFHHDLVRHALAESLGTERRRLIHEKLAVSLAAREGAAARVAAHFVAAEKSQEAIPFFIRAAEDALKVFAYGEALEQYDKSLRLPLTSDQAFEAHVRRSAIHRVRDDRSAWNAEVEALEKLALSASAVSRARASFARAELHNSGGRYEDALLAADRSIELFAGDDGVVCHALLEGSRSLLNLGRLDAARERLGRAAARAPEHDPALRGEIHRVSYACALEENDLETARHHNELARQADQARADPYGLITARINDGTLRRRAGDLRAAIEHLSLAVKEADDAGLVSLERSALLSLASAHNLLGEYARAAELAARGIELAKEPEDPLLEARFENALAAFEYSLGNLASSIAHSERAIEIALAIQAASWSTFVRMGLGHTYLELGEFERALPVIQAARQTTEELDLGGHRVVVETHLAHAELHLEGPVRAVERLESVLASGAPPSLDPDYTFSILALAKHATGDARGALETLSRHSFRPIHRSRALSVELDAKRSLGQDVARELTDAESLLEDPGLTPVESLELRRAVIRARAAAGEHAEEQRARTAAATTVRRIGDSLATRPELAHAFIERNRDLLS
jgi:DNA-binding SARP family transcriptional activator